MEQILQFDFSVLNWIQQTMRNDVLDYVMAFFSAIGHAGLIWIIAGVILLFFRKTRVTGMIMLAAMLVGYLAGDLVLKPLVQRPRPFVFNPAVKLFISPPSGYSFPSGHSTCAASAATVLLKRNKTLGLIALPVALLIMFSRLYNYVHFPTDVLTGMLLGICTAVIMLLIARAVRLDDRLPAYKKAK